MKSVVAAVATIGVVAAQTPSAPSWPKEFQTELTVVDTRNNHTQVSDYSFSVSNLGTQDDFSRFTNATWIDFHDFGNKVDYEVITFPGHPTQCRERPERGQLPIPPVNTFSYQGTVKLPNGESAYKWSDPTYKNFDYFTTADTNEYPIAFYDTQNQIAQEFRNFQPVTTWPNGFWSKPAGCK